MPASIGKKIIILSALLATVTFAFFSYRQYSSSIRNLAKKTLFRGRIVLGTEFFSYDSRDPNRNGSLKNIQDGDLESAVLMAYPAQHPEGTHLSIDTALSHWPPKNKNEYPRTRIPRKIIIYNGPCTVCEMEEFNLYSRVKRAKIEFLVRQANDPDKEFLHEKTLPRLVLEKEFADRPGPQTVELELIDFKKSNGYPKHVFYIVIKISIMEVYPGTRFPGRAALSELHYVDSPVGTPATEKSQMYIWK